MEKALKKYLPILGVSIIFFVTILLRFWDLGKTPPGLNIDEASYGFDAYSLLKTGKDQWGVRFPLVLKSFGDFKPAALSYAIIPFIGIFDLSTVAVRFPSAIAGILTVLVLYLTLRELKISQWLSVFLALVYSLSPFPFGISRLFYEPNIGLLFTAVGFLYSLKLLKKDSLKYALFSALAFGIAGYWYVAIRVSCALIVLFLAVVLFLRSHRFNQTIAVLLSAYVLVSLPLLAVTFSHEGLTRLRQESGGQDFGNALVINENRSMCYLSSGKSVFAGKTCALFWNKPTEKITHVITSLLDQFGVTYLFLKSNQPDVVSAPYAPYSWILIPLYLLGLFTIAKQYLEGNGQAKTLSLFLAACWLAGSLPAAMAGVPILHRDTLGIYFSYLPVAIGAAFGAHYLFATKLGKGIFILYSLGIAFVSVQFLIAYFAISTKLQPNLWRYDSAEIMTYVKLNENAYDSVILKGFEDAPLYYAFYAKTSPSIVQEDIKRTESGDSSWIHNLSLGKLSVEGAPLAQLLCERYFGRQTPKILYVTTPNNDFSQYAEFKTYSYNGVNLLHEAYNLEKLYQTLKLTDWDFSNNCKVYR